VLLRSKTIGLICSGKLSRKLCQSGCNCVASWRALSC